MVDIVSTLPDSRSIRWGADWHRFVCNDLRLLVDANLGAVHVLDQHAWAVLDAWEHGAADAGKGTSGSPGASGNLGERSGALGASPGLDRDQARTAAQELAAVLVPHPATYPQGPVPQTGLKALCLNVAHQCNLRCRYCFADQGHPGGVDHSPTSLMSAEVGRAALDLLIEASGDFDRLEVDFFGGEPLMNWATVQDLISYGRYQAGRRGKSIHFTLTTNAVLLSQEVLSLLNEAQVSLIMSLDGRPEIHDGMRPRPGGQGGSYELVSSRIQAAARSRHHQDYWVRGTYTRYNLDFCADAKHLIDDLGLQNISLEPVVAQGGEEGSGLPDYALQPKDLPELAQQYHQLAYLAARREQEGRPFSFYHFNLDLDHGPCLAKRITGCGAGYDYMAVTPEGALYPCHQLVGQEEFKLGDITAGVVRPRLVEEFRQAHVGNKPACRDCWARFWCGGGCHANALAFTHDLYQPYELGCALQKLRIEAGLYVQAKRYLAHQAPDSI